MRPLLTIFFIVVFDQATKFIVQSRFALGEGFNVINGLFDIRYVQNTGAAFGILEGFNIWLVALSLVMLAFLIGFRKRLFSDMRYGTIVYSLLVAGIIGNFIDRIKYGYVIDFIYLYWRGHDFPAFNVADSAISIGACAYIVLQKFVRTDNTTAASAIEKTNSD